MDITFNAVKSVSLARELAYGGDARIEDAHREAVAYTMGLIERDMQGRVRMGGANDNRTTGNLVAYRVTHRDTRVNADDQMPDPHLHDHVFVFNTTYDPIEKKWKAAELGRVKHDLPYYESVYNNRLAAHLKSLGYGVERKGKAFEISGIDRPLLEKFSRRSRYINAVAAKLGIVRPESKDKLGATTRLGKTKETAEDLQGYYVSRLTDAEKQQLNSLLGRPSSEKTAEEAVAYALSHEFERRSVVDERKVYETALRHGVGSVTPEEVQAEAKRQGLLVRGMDATTKAVLAEEARIIQFARDGRGTCRPLAEQVPRLLPTGSPLTLASRETPQLMLHKPTKEGADTATLSPDQQAVSSLSSDQANMVNHVLTSPDRVILARGAAGTGKTHSMKAAISRIDRPVVVLAPSADASRGVLRKEGFAEADTVARFLQDKAFQERAKNGLIWVDEAALMAGRDTARLFDAAGRLNARVVLMGDPRQHRSVAREGSLFQTLQQYAKLPVAELTDIRRQSGRYKEAVAAIERGDIVAGHDIFVDLGWVHTTPQLDHNRPVADAYLEAIDTKRADQEVTDRALVVAPTHAEGAEVTAAIRQGLKARGMLGEEREFATLIDTQWTAAEKGDLERYDGSEVLCFHNNSGSFRRGQRVAVADFKRGQRIGPPSTYTVHRSDRLKLAVGDRVRITANGLTADRQHRLNSKAMYTVAGFEPDGRIRLDNGWTVAADFGHLAHGYVTTSIAGQGKTVDRVFLALGRESLPAINAAQFYTSASRARHSAAIFTDVPAEELKSAIQRADTRQSATSLMQSKPRRPEWWMLRRAKEAWQQLRDTAIRAIQEKTRERMYAHGR